MILRGADTSPGFGVSPFAGQYELVLGVTQDGITVQTPAPIAGAGVPGLILASGGREATTIGNRRMVLSVAGGNVWRLKAVD
jgi:hypothetical protein